MHELKLLVGSLPCSEKFFFEFFVFPSFQKPTFQSKTYLHVEMGS